MAVEHPAFSIHIRQGIRAQIVIWKVNGEVPKTPLMQNGLDGIPLDVPSILNPIVQC